MESLPSEIFQLVINEIVVTESLWNALVLRRTCRLWDTAILRAICIEGVLDPLADYGRDTKEFPFKSNQDPVAPPRLISHMCLRPPHWEMAPIMRTLAESSNRYAINTISLVIRRAADWIDQNLAKELPGRTSNLQLLAEVFTLLDKTRTFWDAFEQGDHSPAEKLSPEHDDTRSRDLAMGIAIYKDDMDAYRAIRGGVSNPHDMFLSATVAAAHRGNVEILDEILKVAETTEIDFVHLGQKHTGYIAAIHWKGVFNHYITYNTNGIFVQLVALTRLVYNSQAGALRWFLRRESGWANRSRWLSQVIAYTKDLETVKVILEDLRECCNEDSRSKTNLLEALQRAALVAGTFGNVDIIEYLLDEGFNGEGALNFTINPLTGKVVRSTAREMLLNVAVKNGRTEAIELLLKRGIRPNITYSAGYRYIDDAMSCAVASKRPDIQKMFIKSGYDGTKLLSVQDATGRQASLQD
ncbi:hypothetical protein H072_6316 [Dactylellina haptotyla CBS 200.50]|uniref:Uncharacterized protein n=1 Tax=Dactylellina haptotyla (strain CBS 200.50) TaxID=1284197 RepID=S8BXD6_DACHA|nr:hypothetical protein H072_6316 [Dactylellina haptotyla CBS 200.50]